jgi:multisubunit Na+/H+ antiporter MnhE subunit
MLQKIYYTADLIFYFLVHLVKANLLITYDILTPVMRARPGFIKISLTIRQEWGLLLFSNLLSMTPGTLSIDMDSDRKSLIVHVLYKFDEEDLMKEIQKIQDKISRITG